MGYDLVGSVATSARLYGGSMASVLCTVSGARHQLVIGQAQAAFR